MCTITYFPKTENSFLITHNRDEDVSRKGGSPPEVFKIGKRNVIMPLDRQSGGTWIAATRQGNVYCIMNGAFQRHTSSPPYKHSRGLLIPQLLEEEHFRDYYRETDFAGIEPFTLFHFSTGLIEKIVWDGLNKFYGQPDAAKAQLFTSATLYDEETGLKRTLQFHEFIKRNPRPASENLLKLHQKTETDPARSFILETGQGVKTVSITQVEKTGSKINMVYLDLLTGQRSEAVL